MREPAAFEVDGALPARSLALEASAGTGKTWTLTSLTVRYVAEGVVELPELLLVTFTRAATAELRDRVRTRLLETVRVVEAAGASLLADPAADVLPAVPQRDRLLLLLVGDALEDADPVGELQRRAGRLRRALAQLDEATIATIHGFCQAMLRHAALEAGVDLDAELLEDDTALLAELVDDHLVRELRTADPGWIRYLQASAGIGRPRLEALAREVAGLPTGNLVPVPTDPVTPDHAPWRDALAVFRQRWSDDGPVQARQLLERLAAEGAFASPRQRIFTPRELDRRVPLIDRWLEQPHPYPPAPGAVRGRAELHRQEDHPYAYLTTRALARNLAPTAVPPDVAIVAAADDLLSAVLAPATRFLHRAGTAFRRELEERAQHRTVMTFDDLLRRLATALASPATAAAVRRTVRQRYRLALIDEFQDTDPVQWSIFAALFDPQDPLILIGDPKQAIYGFRGADLHTYVRARDTRPDRATLATNHRSDPRYVAACNALFGQPRAFADPDVGYHELDAAQEDRLEDPAGGAALAVRVVTRAAAGVEGNDLITKGWADRNLPRDVAAVAAELLSSRVTLPAEGGGRRPLAPRDLAVLVRTNRRAAACQRALKDAGIPAVIQRGGSVYDTEEADALQRLLAAMLRPSWHRAAISAAATPLFGRDAAELARQLTALESRDVVEGLSGAGPDPQLRTAGAAWDAWVDALSRWGARWQRQGVLAAVQTALTEEGVAARLLAHDDGDRRLTNLRHLLELLHSEEAAAGTTGHALLAWLEDRRVEAAQGHTPTSDTELRLEADAEAVRVVTVHGSKGLQYPLVLCPDLWDGRDRTNAALTRFHLPGVTDPAAAITLDLDVDVMSPDKQDHLALARQEDHAEQLRLAYVALTRAEHRCVVWWGAFADAPRSPLASLLHGGAIPLAATEPDGTGPGERSRALAEWVTAAPDEDLLADLQRLCADPSGTIGVEVVAEVERHPIWSAPRPAALPLTVRHVTRRLDRRWQRTSFSALIRPVVGAHTTTDALASGPTIDEDEEDGRDVDARAEAVDATALPAADEPPDGLPTVPQGGGTQPTGSRGASDPAAAPVPLAGFPRGPGPGTFLHDVLERVDFTALDDDGHLDTEIARSGRRHGIDPVHHAAVAEGVRRALDTPLDPIAPGVRLADLARTDRRDEVRFELPVAGGHRATPRGFQLPELADRLEASTDPLVRTYAGRLRDPALAGVVRGYLTGSIDLLARLPDGRFLVADYKSNWLGDRRTERSVPADYRPERLMASMLDHHYVLQGLLYLAAAHRFLRWRLPGYDYDTHMAGAGYLFLRGMVGGGAGTTGIVTLTPEGALIEDLSRMLDGGR